MADPRRPRARTCRVHLAVLAAVLAACGSSGPAAPPQAKPAPAPSALTAQLGDRLVTIEIEGESIGSVGVAPAGAQSAGWIVPALIDSHVHFAFWPVSDEAADAGLGAAVDLAAPVESLGMSEAIPLRQSGPMITSPGGYPLSTWGPDGFGIGCGDAACVTETVADLKRRGADLIKVPIGEDGLDPKLVPVVVKAAREKQLIVVAHALGAADTAVAASAGVIALAHTPVDKLSDTTVRAWRGRGVISTLAAFGETRETIENLRRLRAAGAIVLYGTDLGNLRDAGPSAREIELLVKAGLDGAAILDAMTTAPAKFWGFSRLGAIAPGKEASFVVLAADPRVDPMTLAKPREVWLKGVRRRGTP